MKSVTFWGMFSKARRMKKDGFHSTTFNTNMASGSKAILGNHNEFHFGAAERKENATSGKCCHLLKENLGQAMGYVCCKRNIMNWMDIPTTHVFYKKLISSSLDVRTLLWPKVSNEFLAYIFNAGSIELIQLALHSRKVLWFLIQVGWFVYCQIWAYCFL